MQADLPFRMDETHGVLERPGSQRRASSDGYHWTTLFASSQEEKPYEAFFPAVRDQLIVLHRTGPAAIDRMDDDKPLRRVVPAGGIHLIPGGMSFGFRLLNSLDTLHVYVRRSVIEEVSSRMVKGDPSKIEIRPTFADSDTKLRHILEAIDHSLGDSDYATALHVDYLSRALAAHLVGNYSSARLRPAPEGSAARSIGPITREAIAFMRDNLEHSISIVDIARVINRSPGHFARQFRNEVGMPPHQYLVNLRLERAKFLLERTQNAIAQIAFECGFAHQEHLTRAFRRRYDTTPGAYRKAHRN